MNCSSWGAEAAGSALSPLAEPCHGEQERRRIPFERRLFLTISSTEIFPRGRGRICAASTLRPSIASEAFRKMEIVRIVSRCVVALAGDAANTAVHRGSMDISLRCVTIAPTRIKMCAGMCTRCPAPGINDGRRVAQASAR